MRISYINVIWNKSTLIFTIFSASWKSKYATFLDPLGPQNAHQNLSSLTDQLKISYLQHWKDLPDLNSFKVALKKCRPVNCPCRICKVCFLAGVGFVWKIELNLIYLDNWKNLYFNHLISYRYKFRRQPVIGAPY